MSFSLLRSLVRHTLQKTGDYLTGGTFPVGSIAAGIFDDWCGVGELGPSAAAGQRYMQMELAKIVQDLKGYRQQIETLVAESSQSSEVQRKAMGFLIQMPGKIQASLCRRDDPTGLTVPSDLAVRRPEDLLRFLPDRLPRFQAGDRPVPGNDLVLEELVGVGGFGEVWKAVHKNRPHLPPVALKFCTEESALRSLRKEVELLDRVHNKGRHRGIVELIYAHLECDTPCLEYEFVDGGDLAALIADMHKSGKAQPLTMAKIARLIAIPVGHAHRVKPPIVHRDLKPQNILTTKEAGKLQFKIADFGIGGIVADKAIQEWTSETKAGSHLTESAGSCTPLYASPQQRRFAPADPRDDVYALGVIIYQMLLGDVTKEPPRGGSWKRRLAEKGVPESLIAIVERCIEDDPAERHADAQELADELGRIVEGVGAETKSGVAEVGKPYATPAPGGRAMPPPLPIAEPIGARPPRPPLPDHAPAGAAAAPTRISILKRIGLGALGAVIFGFGIMPLGVFLDYHDAPTFIQVLVALWGIGLGVWYGACRAVRYSWKPVAIVSGAAIAISITLSVIIGQMADAERHRRWREQDRQRLESQKKGYYNPPPSYDVGKK